MQQVNAVIFNPIIRNGFLARFERQLEAMLGGVVEEFGRLVLGSLPRVKSAKAPIKEVAHLFCDFADMGLEREVARVEKVDFLPHTARSGGRRVRKNFWNSAYSGTLLR